MVLGWIGDVASSAGNAAWFAPNPHADSASPQKFHEVELPPAREATYASRAGWFKFRSVPAVTWSALLCARRSPVLSCARRDVNVESVVPITFNITSQDYLHSAVVASPSSNSSNETMKSRPDQRRRQGRGDEYPPEDDVDQDEDEAEDEHY
ncbi:hypothetical protein BDZ89DRAFT_1052269 [Hymenopellis radicata]|nr:hypothetical protein BDZ89DRAFT_1052269 [Hymenopellis radicata]